VNAEPLHALCHLLIRQCQASLFLGHIGELAFQRPNLDERRLLAFESRTGKVFARAQRAPRLFLQMAGSGSQAFGLPLKLSARRGDFDQTALQRAQMELLLTIRIVEYLARGPRPGRARRWS
jgi:hypothetical protein